METVVVTRHPALVEYLREIGIKVETVIDRATPEEVRGRHVYGVLPLHLAAEARLCAGGRPIGGRPLFFQATLLPPSTAGERTWEQAPYARPLPPMRAP